MPAARKPSGVRREPRRLVAPEAGEIPRILSRAESEALFKRISALATSGGDTQVTIRATWISSLRWGRNRPTASSSTTEQLAVITRVVNGVQLSTELTKLDDASVKQAMQELEQPLAAGGGGGPNGESGETAELLGKQEYLTPASWSDTTYQMTPQALSDAARKTVDPVVDAKLVGAGYAEVGAMSWAIFNTRGLNAYGAATGATYTETVRLPDGSGSGWAGKSHIDWSKLDVPALSATALQKCKASANPYQIEPGRYTAILEPNVVGGLVLMMFLNGNDSRDAAEKDSARPFFLAKGQSKIGQQVCDPRLTITTDPADPECGFIPFDPEGNPYRKVTWIENGILKELAYDREYARKKLGTEVALPNPRAYRMSGGPTTIEEMIASTDRGIYVTELSSQSVADTRSATMVEITRNGLWLIEHGKIVHPIKNLWTYNSDLAVLNQVLQLGPPVRTVGPIVRDELTNTVERDLPTQVLSGGHIPNVMPPMKVKDFNFTRLIDAI